MRAYVFVLLGPISSPDVSLHIAAFKLHGAQSVQLILVIGWPGTYLERHFCDILEPLGEFRWLIS